MLPLSCDTMVALGNATQNRQTIFAKNSDRPATECQPLELHERQQYRPGDVVHCQFVTVPQVTTTYRHIGSRPYWCWGYEHGFNEHQVVIGNEALPSKLPEATEPRLVGMEILRLGLERSRSAAEAVAVITDLISLYGQGKFTNSAGVRTYDNGYIVADPTEAYVIEAAGHEWVVKSVTKPLGISNVYSVETDWTHHSPTAVDTALEQTGWQPQNGRFNFADAYTATSRTEGSGAMRRGRSCALLNQRAGAINAQSMMAVLSDHGDGHAAHEPWQTRIQSGVGICMHPTTSGEGSCTAASLVADLCADGTRLPIYWCSLYSPCLSLFLPIFMEGNLPPVLTQGDATASDTSPWWLFYQLNRAVMSNPDHWAPFVRARWRPFQDELFASAYALAHRALRAISEGKREEARQWLTHYMEDNAAHMVTLVTMLVRELAEQKIVI
ncbi:MAG: C69 family dipeptidase [Chloroflexi bacterium]|nr:C69 family dipeptidase [Chloroflexota bacterium]